jgi:phosphoglycolate phosphatase-like HAD superfamily hydrolase
MGKSAVIFDIDGTLVTRSIDTPYDAETAAKAKLRMIGLLCGGWSEADLRNARCIAVYRDPADLMVHYEESPIGRPD